MLLTFSGGSGPSQIDLRSNPATSAFSPISTERMSIPGISMPPISFGAGLSSVLGGLAALGTLGALGAGAPLAAPPEPESQADV